MHTLIIGMVVGVAGAVTAVIGIAKVAIGYAVSLMDHNPD